MLFSIMDESFEAVPFCGYTKINGKEKDLENLLSKHLHELFIEDDLLMTIFQERQGQEAPDVCALDKEGNMIIFELKRERADSLTTLQVMRYAQLYGKKSYLELQNMYKSFCVGRRESYLDLAEAHQKAFGLDEPLVHDSFNRKQRLIIVGNSSDEDLRNSVSYWKSAGLNIDFIPYRFYDICGKLYFEFFSKPYDFHLNPSDRKAIIFDTNNTYDSNSIWEMFKLHKVSAYGDVCRYVDRFKKSDIVLYYHTGFGIVAAGEIISKKSDSVMRNDEKEKYQKVKFFTPIVTSESELKSISPRELTEITGKRFFYASTAKSPYLSIEEAHKIIGVLMAKYEGNVC